MNHFDTRKLARIALLPCVAALTLAFAPAHAISISAGSTPAASSQASISSQPSMTKKQLKQQRKMAKKCKKVTKKLAKAKVGTSRHATLTTMQGTYCGKPSTPAASVVDQPSKPGSAPAESSAEEAPASGNAGGSAAPAPAANSNAPSNSPNPNASSPRNTPPVLAELLNAPPIFLPVSQNEPAEQGSTEPEAGYKPDDLEILAVALPPTDVPEPGSLALLGLGLVGLGLARRRSAR